MHACIDQDALLRLGLSFSVSKVLLCYCRELISPVVRGAENLPSCSDTARPILFVGNHARIGLFDMPFLMVELYLRGLKVGLPARSLSRIFRLLHTDPEAT